MRENVPVLQPRSQASRQRRRRGGARARSRASPRTRPRRSCASARSRPTSSWRRPAACRRRSSAGLATLLTIRLLVEAGLARASRGRRAAAGIAPLQRVLRDDMHQHAGPQRGRAPRAAAAAPRPGCRRCCRAARGGSRRPYRPAASADRGTARRTGGSRPTARPCASASKEGMSMKTGSRAVPLDVVGGGILQDHALVERRAHQVEMQQRRILQHAEGPFVGIGDEGDARVLRARPPSRLRPRRALGDARSVATMLPRSISSAKNGAALSRSQFASAFALMPR